MSESGQPKTPWRQYTFAPNEAESARFGPLTLRFRRDRDESWIAWARDDSAEADSQPAELTEEPAEPEWQRWVARERDGPLAIKPALPDRTLVVAPEARFHLMPRATARIYIRVPLVAQVVLPESAETPLLEIPTIVMSNTWWGDFVDGELCYWLPTTARRALKPEHLQRPHLVACPIEIENASEEVLHVEKTALRAEHLSVFAADGQLWADETHVRFSGHEDGSEIDTSGRPPPEAPSAELIAQPRTPLDRGFRARSFAKLKSLSGFAS